MNEAPNKIYVDEENKVWIKDTGDTCYIRADIVKEMAEALECSLSVLSGESMSKRSLIDALEKSKSSLAKYKGETQ
jgi:hypothetical protein